MLASCLTALLVGTVTEWTCAQWVVGYGAGSYLAVKYPTMREVP